MEQRRTGRPCPLVSVSYCLVPRPAASTPLWELVSDAHSVPHPRSTKLETLRWVLNLSAVKIKIRVRRVRQDWASTESDPVFI